MSASAFPIGGKYFFSISIISNIHIVLTEERQVSRMYIISAATSGFNLACFIVRTEETRLQMHSEGAAVAIESKVAFLQDKTAQRICEHVFSPTPKDCCIAHLQSSIASFPLC
jgi:hypothetical protein